MHQPGREEQQWALEGLCRSLPPSPPLALDPLCLKVTSPGDSASPEFKRLSRELRRQLHPCCPGSPPQHWALRRVLLCSSPPCSRDHGSFNLKVENVYIKISLQLGSDTLGKPTVDTSACSTHVSGVRVHFSGKLG